MSYSTTIEPSNHRLESHVVRHPRTNQDGEHSHWGQLMQEYLWQAAARAVAETPKDRYTRVVVTWAGAFKAAGTVWSAVHLMEINLCLVYCCTDKNYAFFSALPISGHKWQTCSECPEDCQWFSIRSCCLNSEIERTATVWRQTRVGHCTWRAYKMTYFVGELCELPCNHGQNNTVSSNLHLQVYGAEKMQMWCWSRLGMPE